MKFIGIIPARGGSKEIPLKSITNCAGKPLLSYTYEAARQSKYLNRIILSTDSEKIADLGKSFGIEVPFLRPAQFADDNTPMIHVLQHFLDEFLPIHQGSFALVLLQPTSPMRRASHIDEAIELFINSGSDSLVSVTKVPHQFNPLSIMRMASNRILSSYQNDSTNVLRRQDKPVVFARNGPAILITTPSLVKAGRLYGDKNIGYEMNFTDSIDIDGKDDLKLAELLILHEKESNV